MPFWSFPDFIGKSTFQDQMIDRNFTGVQFKFKIKLHLPWIRTYFLEIIIILNTTVFDRFHK